MNRFLTLLAVFIGLLCLELGLLRSLPGMLRHLPLVVAVVVYLIQHQGFKQAFLWLVALGITLDYFHLGIVPFETLPYAACAVVALVLAERVFSNRSLYGVWACTILSWGTLILIETAELFLRWAKDPRLVDWSQHGIFILSSLGGLLVISWILFQFGSRIRSFLHRTFLLSTSRL